MSLAAPTGSRPRAFVAHAELRTRHEGGSIVALQRTLARACVQAAAARAGWSEQELSCGALGAPLATAGGWHWSLSHARGRVAGAASSAPVGIDLEPRDRSIRAADRFANESELDALAELESTVGRREALVRLWTAKEAVLKREGVGLAGLSRCRLIGVPEPDSMLLDYRGEPRRVVHLELGEHVLAACLGECLPRLACGDLDLSREGLPA